MYTSLHFYAELKKDTPDEVIKQIKDKIENHINSDSYYFDENTINTLEKDNTTSSYFLSVRTNIKNHDSQLEKFIEFVTPYLEKNKGDFLGFIRFEETEIPTLIYYPNTYFTPDIPKNITEE